MQCPECREELKRRLIGTVEVDECAKCNGIWFDKDELRKSKDAVDPDLDWMDFDLWKHEDQFAFSSESVACPKCGQNMAAVEYSQTGVEVKVCSGCKGVWLAGGKFGKIIEALENELLSKGTLDYLKASLAEAKELITGPESFVSEWRDFVNVMRMLEFRVLAENPRLRETLAKIQEVNPLR